ncbi:terminal nucleotidyltransferase 4B isoform X2 [Manihot esculenta]|uniref:terminal nucleotidyltransferase 4B isoform X2 n=1 Tax=Manihot esculenta TaxID=3983 RepID=UPI000B5D10D9|nr:terminal nucleotidyltransferase 4B isoform X2 [Manihot esculenta]
MDMDSPPQTPIPLYETTTALSLPPTTPNRSPLSDSLEPYSVFRNEISLSSANCAAVDSAAPDFFSLDLGGASEQESEPKTPSRAPEFTPKTKLQSPLEPSLEGSWFRGNSRFRSPMLQLHKEIVDFCDFLSPTPEEQAARDSAVKCVFSVIKYIWPNCKVEVFGSYKTGLYLPTSDIDVVILGSGIKYPQIGLQALSRALSQKGIAKKIQVIAKARVPIVKFIERQSGVSFDISFDVDNGPKAAKFIKDAVSKWPALRPLCLILKLFLQQRELNEVYSGGVGSYALLAMLMAMLKLHFFDFYGRKLNTKDVGVSCNGAGTFFSKHRKGFMNKGRPFLIAIEDPQAPDNDIGKNSFNYFQIRSAFSMAFSTLSNPKTILSLGPNRSILGTIIRPDPVLLQRKGGCNGEVTFTALLPGAGEPVQSHDDDHQEILGNWLLDDEEELPRGGGETGDGDAQSSGKKRKSSSKGKSFKKKENGDAGNLRREESGSRRERKKQRWRHNRDDANGFSNNIGAPWRH